jgi:hypothetical protein
MSAPVYVYVDKNDDDLGEMNDGAGAVHPYKAWALYIQSLLSKTRQRRRRNWNTSYE